MGASPVVGAGVGGGGTTGGTPAAPSAGGGALDAAGLGDSINAPFNASKSGLLIENVPAFPSSVAFHVWSGVLPPMVTLPVFLSAVVNVITRFGFSSPCS